MTSINGGALRPPGGLHMEPKIFPEIDAALCDGCGRCLPACLSGALGVRAGKAALINPDLCRYDGSCELVCPTNAIRVPYAIGFRDDPARAAQTAPVS
jgi:ferredoxin